MRKVFCCFMGSYECFFFFACLTVVLDNKPPAVILMPCKKLYNNGTVLYTSMNFAPKKKRPRASG